ncbi:hydrogen peroxide-inducible genes activator [Alistipes sp.]|nr:hydrogen peroxide-inducible genes activator [uncultured Alistipes sp.]MDO5385317.1 hydrogen peroxide-inducible genes activator [Rikenellaceae bacterium]
MTIIQLEYLLAVANYGSFSLAAEKCFVTQPSLSMQVKNLEEELGVIVLDRSKKPVLPTDAGLAVIRQAKEAVQAFAMVREVVSDLQNEISGTLRLGVIPTIAPYLLHRFIPDFVRKCPKVELQIREMMTGNIIRALDRDMLDAAIMAGGTSPEGIREEELFNDRFFAYVSTDHPLCQRSNIRIEDIDVRHLLLLSEGNCLRDQVIELCQAQKNIARQYSFESGSLETLMRIVDNTPNLITIIPEMVADYIDEKHRPQVKTLAKGAASRKITIAVRRTYVKRSLIDALKESVMNVARN